VKALHCKQNGEDPGVETKEGKVPRRGKLGCCCRAKGEKTGPLGRDKWGRGKTVEHRRRNEKRKVTAPRLS